MQARSRIFAAILSLSAALTTGAVMAAGTVSGVTTDKANINLGQSLNANVNGTINKDNFKRGCQVRLTLKYADNTSEIPVTGLLVDTFPATGFYLKPTKVGAVKVIADGGGSNNLGWPACLGSAQTTIQVMAPVVVDANPNIKVAPHGGISAQQNGPISSLPPAAIQLPTLTSIKQVQYTDHSGETWIEVSGTGNCTYKIDGAGLPSAPFASTAAKPFPMKVKINGAPLGSYQWKASGTGSCSGEASATFSVD